LVIRFICVKHDEIFNQPNLLIHVVLIVKRRIFTQTIDITLRKLRWRLALQTRRWSIPMLVYNLLPTKKFRLETKLA
ncbi:MAG TPA: hypothetical protein DCP63_15030, partial [Bacteroidetes bacterium]|nr:hypothetical protein [Bacteroidota bacterium]